MVVILPQQHSRALVLYQIGGGVIIGAEESHRDIPQDGAIPF